MKPKHTRKTKLKKITSKKRLSLQILRMRQTGSACHQLDPGVNCHRSHPLPHQDPSRRLNSSINQHPPSNSISKKTKINRKKLQKERKWKSCASSTGTDTLVSFKPYPRIKIRRRRRRRPSVRLRRDIDFRSSRQCLATALGSGPRSSIRSHAKRKSPSSCHRNSPLSVRIK